MTECHLQMRGRCRPGFADQAALVQLLCNHRKLRPMEEPEQQQPGHHQLLHRAQPELHSCRWGSWSCTPVCLVLKTDGTVL